MSTTVPGLVSVILPNRDHAHYLPTALDALLAQTRPELEILVIDDASSDHSKDVMQAYAARDARVRMFALPENVGVNRAVEFARPHARGEFLYFAAADDFIAAGFFAASIEQLTKHPKAGLCFSDPTEFYEQDDRRVRFPLYLTDQPACYDPQSLQALLAQNYFHISSNTALYRASAFDDAGGYRDELGWLSDWFVTLVVALRNGACYVPEALTFLRVRADSFSAVTRRDPRAHCQPFQTFLSLLGQPAFADIAVRLQHAGILPEYRLRTLRWLMQDEQGRKFITLQLAGRVLSRAAWSHLRPLAPSSLRRHLRKLASGR